MQPYKQMKHHAALASRVHHAAEGRLDCVTWMSVNQGRFVYTPIHLCTHLCMSVVLYRVSLYQETKYRVLYACT